MKKIQYSPAWQAEASLRFLTIIADTIMLAVLASAVGKCYWLMVMNWWRRVFCIRFEFALGRTVSGRNISVQLIVSLISDFHVL